MKSFVLLLTFAFFAGLCASAQNRSIKFEIGTFKEALDKAKKTNRLIFLDANTSWCAPCKRMEKNVFTQDAVADYFNQTFVNVKMDMEKGEGVELAKMLKITAYPSLFLLDANGEVKHRVVGYMEGDKLISSMKEGAGGQSPYIKLKAAYENGQKDTAFINRYIKVLNETGLYDEANSVAKATIKAIPEENKVSPLYWHYFSEHIRDPFDEEFLFVVKNRKQFGKVIGDTLVNDKITYVIGTLLERRLLQVASGETTDENAGKIISLIDTMDIENKLYFKLLAKLTNAKNVKDVNTILNLTSDYVLKKGYNSFFLMLYVANAVAGIGGKENLKAYLKVLQKYKDVYNSADFSAYVDDNITVFVNDLINPKKNS